MILTEQGVVDAVKAWMNDNGFVDVKAVVVGRRGYDIEGTSAQTGEHWLIEAKGGSHAGEDSSSRAWMGVGAAFLMTAGWRYQPDLAGKRFAIAVPDSRWFNIHVGRIEEPLRVLGISVFRVSETGHVTFIENHPATPSVSTVDAALQPG
ncbi:MAG: hypothetical protein P0Y66_02555 [Candidatus Kaistia colombiensis]|nr:MAG: hypothetical protein P0Y66_02555 [Kaistia sp.]